MGENMDKCSSHLYAYTSNCKLMNMNTKIAKCLCRRYQECRVRTWRRTTGYVHDCWQLERKRNAHWTNWHLPGFCIREKDVVPIPRTSKKVNRESNIGAIGVTLSKEEIVDIEAAMRIADISGDRNLDNQSIRSTMQQSTTSFTGRLPVVST